jgi:hypothetical protein
MTDEQMRDLVKECGLDWQRGYMPLFADDPTNRYAVLIEAVESAERHNCSIAVWMTLQEALAPDADDKGLEGWLREAERRVKEQR